MGSDTFRFPAAVATRGPTNQPPMQCNVEATQPLLFPTPILGRRSADPHQWMAGGPPSQEVFAVNTTVPNIKGDTGVTNPRAARALATFLG